MNKIMKRIVGLLLLIAGIITISACSGNYTLKFNTNGGTPKVNSIKVPKGEAATAPDVDLEKDGYVFEYWYLDDEEVKFDFRTLIDKNLVLNAKWAKLFKVSFDLNNPDAAAREDIYVKEGDKLPRISKPKNIGVIEFIGWYVNNENELFDLDTPITNDITLHALWDNSEELATEDYNAIVNEGFLLDDYTLNMPKKGSVNDTNITWDFDSKYISTSGFILPLLPGEDDEEIIITATFKRANVEFEKQFSYKPKYFKEVVIDSKREVEFENLTTEYDVEDGSLNLYFEKDGTIPYVSILDFFDLVKGFIDEEVEFEVTKTDKTLEIAYDYYDEDEDHTYHLVNTIDLETNTISTTDPGFYWAYVLTTETNYGRHIEYLYDHEDNYTISGNDVVYELSNYNLSLTSYEGEILAPFYLVNQLYAGSSYYNVYYNHDNLYGIYSLPKDTDDEYKTIKTSSKNGENLPADLLAHTINMLAFNMDNFYGLKDILEIDTFYDYIFERKDNLFSLTPRNFENALHDILVLDLDEPHTSYGYPSFYNSSTWSGPSVSFVNQFGQRMQDWYNEGIFAVDDEIGRKWGQTASGWSADSDKRPYYWFLDDEHAVLTFDSFSTEDIEESANYDEDLAAKVLELDNIDNLLPAVDGGNKYFYYNTSSKEHRKLEILVKGLPETKLATYLDAVLALGYEHVVEDSDDEFKEAGYYVIEVDEIEYVLVAAYNERFNLFYVGITNEQAPEEYDDDWPIVANIIELVENDSAVYFEVVLEELFEVKPTVKYITIDLTWNMGGNVGALYRVVGFITDEPFKTSRMNRDTGSASTTHIVVTGVPSYSHIEWSLLTSKVTFSAANSLATMFKENDLGPVIGIQSGGGACSITPILLPNGTAFTMSSNSINAYRIGEGTEQNPYEYLDNEYGIKPDYELQINELLKNESILNILKEHYSN